MNSTVSSQADSDLVLEERGVCCVCQEWWAGMATPTVKTSKETQHGFIVFFSSLRLSNMVTLSNDRVCKAADGECLWLNALNS